MLLANSACQFGSRSATRRIPCVGAFVRHRTLGQIRGLAGSAARATEGSGSGLSTAGPSSGSGSSTNGQTKAKTGRALLGA